MELCEPDRLALPPAEGIAQPPRQRWRSGRQNLVHGDLRYPNILVDSACHPTLNGVMKSGPLGILSHPTLTCRGLKEWYPEG